MIEALPATRVRLHDARHTCGTLMHPQGVPIAVISPWLGHADSSFTMRTYAHSQADAPAAAATSVGSVVTIRDNNARSSWNEESPSPALLQVKGFSKLPRLDSNQQPSD